MRTRGGSKRSSAHRVRVGLLHAHECPSSSNQGGLGNMWGPVPPGEGVPPYNGPESWHSNAACYNSTSLQCDRITLHISRRLCGLYPLTGGGVRCPLPQELDPRSRLCFPHEILDLPLVVLKNYKSISRFNGPWPQFKPCYANDSWSQHNCGVSAINSAADCTLMSIFIRQKQR